jgi:hypothetical protein
MPKMGPIGMGCDCPHHDFPFHGLNCICPITLGLNRHEVAFQARPLSAGGTPFGVTINLHAEWISEILE